MNSNLPSPLGETPFHVSDAARFGVPLSRLRRNDMDSPFRGVRTPAGLETTRALEYAPLLGQGKVFSHVTAARLWGMWLPSRYLFDPLVDVLSLGNVRTVRMQGVRGHHSQSGSVDVAFAHDLPVTAAPDTFRMLSEVLTVHELVAAGDSLVRRERAILNLADLQDAVRAHRGRRGASRLHRALPLIRSGCDSPRETRLRLLLLAHRLPEPQVNALVSKPGKRRRYGDLTFSRYMVIVEYDGVHHRTGAQYAADIERLEELAREGWTVVRVLKEHFDHPERIVERVRVALMEGGWRP